LSVDLLPQKPILDQSLNAIRKKYVDRNKPNITLKYHLKLVLKLDKELKLY